MSVHHELFRLMALFIGAESSPLSCPRDRSILKAKIEDLQQEAAELKERTRQDIERAKAHDVGFAIALEFNETERQRLNDNLQAEPTEWEESNIRLWELEAG